MEQDTKGHACKTMKFQLGSDYRLHPIKERGAGGWMTATK